jgi:2-amino-4-ketopentanoate thiolase beta subunit
VVVQETEYTGAGKHPWAQLAFAEANGVVVKTGSRNENVPGRVIAIPDDPAQLSVEEVGLDALRDSYLRQALRDVDLAELDDQDFEFLAEETRLSADTIRGRELVPTGGS